MTAHAKRTAEKLVVREKVDEPIIRTRLVLEVDKKKFGPIYRKNAKAVEGYLETLKVDENDWDEEKLKALNAQMNANNGCVLLAFWISYCL